MVRKQHSHRQRERAAATDRVTPATAETAKILPEGERRHATVVFADLCGYTEMTDAIDPEEVALLLNRILQAATRIVEAHGGMVNQFVGDQVTAVFGVPASHDDDPRRAVAAALEMHRLVRRLNEEVGARLPQPLAFHTGVNTGLVVTQRRDDREGKFGLTGDAVNTAARLRSVAQPDEIVIGPATHRAVEAYFRTEPLGSQALRGKSQPMELYRVLGPAVQNWSEVAQRRGLSRYTGREREHARLDEWVKDVRAGRGRFVAVIGDPGLGKSRLFFELRRSADDGATTVLEGHCEAYGSVTAFHPFLDVLRQLFEMRPDDGPEAAIRKVVQAAQSFGADVAERIPVYLHLLSIRSAAHPLPRHMVEEELRRAILEALRALLAAVARRRPSVLLLEDWHWADEPSEIALRWIIRRLTAEYPLLVVVSRRPGSEPDWTELNSSLLRLRPLEREESELVIASRFPGRTLPAGLASFIHERTGGNPFFIEEMCRSLAESSLKVAERGALELLHPLDDLAVPEAVHAVVRARIDRLEPRAREVLRVAAVLGRVFSPRLLRAMVDAKTLMPALRRLEDAELIERLPLVDEERYRFSHSITQDVAYDHLLLQRRRELHARAGEAIETMYGNVSLTPHYEILAEHYARSDNDEKAIHYGERAGRKAARTFALEQAQLQYGRVIRRLDRLPETPQRVRKQIDLSLVWAAVGVSAPTRAQVTTLERLYEKALAIGYRGGAARCSYWVGWIEHALGNHSEARRHSERALELADIASDENFVAQVYLNLGQEAYHEADYVTAVDWLTRALTTVGRAADGTAQPIVVPNALGYLALCAAERGEFAEAHAQSAKALAVVREAEHRQLEASMLTVMAWIHTFEGEWALAIDTAQQMLAIAEALGFPIVVGMARTIIGAARLGLGERSGVEQLREAAAHFERHGILFSTSMAYAILAEALAVSGEVAEALRYVEKAFRRCASGDRVGEIQAHRALGRALARSSASLERVRDCFSEAIARARAQQRPREEALTWLSQGEALVELDDSADGRDALRRAATLFDRMSMRWHAARAQTLMA
jgi:predicted ATPase/class 3 adenylate cyclase